MATALIAEFKEIPQEAGGTVPLTSLTPIAEQSVTYSTSTQSSALNANTRYVRITAKDTPAHIKIGSNPTATASTAVWLPAGAWDHFRATAGELIAFYDGTT